MIENFNDEEQTNNRTSKRPLRSSILKPKVLVENKIKEDEQIDQQNQSAEEEEIDEEDPPELYQPGDILWHRVPGNPLWPALVYGCFYEDFLYTKVTKTARQAKRRIYFVYFFGPSFEYAWTNNNFSLFYEGLDEFIKYAEATVAKCTSKQGQESLANRFELKVTASKRNAWDQAIQEADAALKLTREERISNFEQILKIILNKSEEKPTRKRNSSVSHRPSRKFSSSSTEKSSDRSSVKRQKTQSVSLKSSTSFLRFGLPNLTVHDEKKIVETLVERENLSLAEAQSIACQLAMKIVRENSHVEMNCVQLDWFYDFLINNSTVVLKHADWLDEMTDTDFNDSISVKQEKLKILIENQKK